MRRPRTMAPILARGPALMALTGVMTLLLAGSAAWRAQAQQAESTPIDVDRDHLETIEERTEELANRLLELSAAARKGDVDRLVDYFAEAMQATPLPGEPSGEKVLAKWIRRRDWPIAATRSLSRDEFLASLGAFLRHFSSVEDVRFKVKHSQVADSGEAAGGEIKFFVIGRNADEHREWVKGLADFEARRSEIGDQARWQLTRFDLKKIFSKLATSDLFSEVSVAAGIDVDDPPFFEQSGEPYVWRGAAAADVDWDGWIDLFAVGYQSNGLYMNQQDGHFSDAAAAALIDHLPRAGLQPLFLDIDDDGDSDLFISSVGEQMLFENRVVPDGRLEFWDISERLGKRRSGVGFSAVAGDVNGDGHQDIYVCCYNRYGIVMPNDWKRSTNGTPNLLFMNRGDGTFQEEAEKWGVADSRWSYAAGFVDIDEDGDLDLYVANDYGEKGFYINQGGHFTDEARQRGVLDPGNGMGVSFADYDNDGDLDLHVTNMSSTAGNRIIDRLSAHPTGELEVLKKVAAGNTVFENQGNGTFRDVTKELGGLSGGWAWGGGFFDFDNDGHEDLFTPNGFVSGKSMADT